MKINTTTKLLIAILIVTIISLMFNFIESSRLNNLQSNVNNLQHAISNINIQYPVMEDKDRMLESWDVDDEKINEDLTVQVKVTAVPMIIEPNSTLHIVAAGQDIIMTQQEDFSFTGSITLSAMDTFDMRIVSINNDGVQKQETLYTDMSYKRMITPRVSFVGSTQHNNKRVIYDGFIEFHNEDNSLLNIKKTDIIVEIDNKEQDRIPIDSDLKNNKEYSVEFKEEYQLDNNQTVNLWVESTLANGIVIKAMFEVTTLNGDNNNSEAEALYFEDIPMQIVDGEGNILYNSDTITYLQE